ncbi:MAG: TetR/AcrR family transcriptional regulator [Lishizhenia sp.]
MEEKKLEIIEKSARVFMRFGVKSVTMDDLVSKLGVSKKTIYKYFKDKSDLVMHIIKEETQKDKLVCQTCAENSENAIDELIKVNQHVLESHLMDIHPSVFYDMQKYHPEAWMIMEDHKSKFMQNMIAHNVQRGIAENIYRDNVNPEIVSLMYAACIDSVMNQDSIPFGKVYIEVSRFFLRGLVNPTGLNYLQERLKRETDV